MVVVLPTSMGSVLVRGGAESHDCASQRWLFGSRGRVELCLVVGRGGSPFGAVRPALELPLALAEVGSSAPPPRRMIRGTQMMSARLPTAGSLK